MCDTNNCSEMANFQEYYPCDPSCAPQMESQDNGNNEMQYFPPACDQCPEYKENASMCCEPNQNDGCYDYSPQENCNYEQQCGDFEMPAQSYVDQNCCPPNCCSQYQPQQEMDSSEHRPSFCPCPTKCQMPSCSPYARRKYIQPPRVSSFKPIVNYQRPTIPMSCDTIYKKSFEGVEPKTAACCRMALIRPKGYLRSLNSPFEKDTVTKLSFQPYCQVERTKPIIPQSPSLLGTGPMQGLTTQKHDFVPKFQYRRLKILPRDNIKKLCGCVEKTTTQRLSFIAPCVDGKRESFKPAIAYKRPEIPMECETTQKLSYMPVCPSPREEFPWAKKAKYLPPSIGFAKDTVTKLSYQAPGCFVDDCCVPCPNQSFSEVVRC